MRLLGICRARLGVFITAVATFAVALFIMGSPAHADHNGGCVNYLPQERFVELQAGLHVTADGVLGSETCGEVLKLHTVLLEIGSIADWEVGHIGWKTYNAVFNADQLGGPAPCRISSGYERYVRPLQTALKVTVDGDLGPETCSALIGKQRVWVANGVMPESQLGWFGSKTVTQLGLSAATSDTRSTASTTNIGCPVVNRATERVICVDRHARTGTVFAAEDGKLGAKLYGPFELTPSLVDSDGPFNSDGGIDDTVTVTRSWKMHDCQRTSSTGLQYYCEFYRGQGIHYYPYVGPNYDSSGCLRVKMTTAVWLWNDLEVSGRVDRGVVEVNLR